MKPQFTLTLALAFASAFASAQSVAFDDFSNDSNSSTFGYNTGSGGTLDGSLGPVGYSEWANQFVAQASGLIVNLDIPANLIDGTGTLDVTLYSDSGGQIGGTTIESWTMPVSGNAFGGWSTPNVLVGNGTASLVNGTAYWLVVNPTNASTSNLFAVWNFADNGSQGLTASNTGSGFNYSTAGLSAFEVTVAPEPSSLLALGGVAGLISVRRRRAKRS